MSHGFDPAEMPEDELDVYAAHVTESEKQVELWEALGFVSHAVERCAGYDFMLRTQRFVIAGPGDSHTMSGAAATRKPLSEISSFHKLRPIDPAWTTHILRIPGQVAAAAG